MFSFSPTVYFFSLSLSLASLIAIATGEVYAEVLLLQDSHQYAPDATPQKEVP